MKQEYPDTKTVDIVESIHGVKIPDQYRWLEDTSKKEVQDWITAQNSLTHEVLNSYNGQNEVRRRLTDLFDYDLIMPISMQIRKTQSGSRFFYLFRKSGCQQPSLYYQDRRDGERVELVNPLELSSEGLISLDWYYPSKDGSLVAYGLSKDGTEWSVLHILDIERKEVLSERIPRTRGCSLVWLPDNSGFYYTRFPLIGSVPPEEENYNVHVFFHKIGQNYEDDVKVFGEQASPIDRPRLQNNEDCTVLAVDCFRFTSSDIYVAEVDLEDPTNLSFQGMITNQHAISSVLLSGKTAIVATQIDTPNGCILSYNLESILKGGPLGDPTIIVNESESVITPFNDFGRKYAIFGEKLAVIEDRNACSNLKTYDIASGNLLDTVNFNVPMAIDSLYSGVGVGEIYFDAQSFVIPPSIFYYSSETDRGVFYRPTQKVNPDDIVVRQEWYESKDGTRVPMFLIHNRNLTISEQTPVLLGGYGGFALSITPWYGIQNIPWIESGGVLAIANLRGGLEFGQQWHRGGNRENKQNVFDDFISAAEWLVENQIGSIESLAIWGASNGGLLVGAALIQRPNLFNAVCCAVPLLDMVRYTGFEIAKFWIPEYGNPEISEEFQWLYEYSPYHHIRQNQSYPAIFLETADGDSRVDPMHALKMAARLQKESKSNLTANPILLWVESQAGHGVSMSIEKLISSNVQSLIFLAHHTGLDFSKLNGK